MLAILLAEFLRVAVDIPVVSRGERILRSTPTWTACTGAPRSRMFATTLFAVALPLKIWNNIRNEKKLEAQQRLLNEARLTALQRQYNPHFLFEHLELGGRADPVKPRPGSNRGV